MDPYESDQAQWSVSYFFEAERVHGRPSDMGNGYVYLTLLTGWSGQLVPVVLPVALVEMWRRRGTDAGRFAVVLVAGNLAMYLFYYYQSYRFGRVAAAVLIVYAAAFVGRMMGSWSGEAGRRHRVGLAPAALVQDHLGTSGRPTEV